MKLKRVRIFGFKTFADKTQLDLQGEIAAIVGPNGCGKSNIVDAIQWGLGEANARQLRAQTSQEVIFSGSQGRKPVGFAEVTLLFDNEDGQLPIDSPEVAITRRITRSGESGYMINRRPCRLRDVSDLLADSGLGRAGYAIVSQSEIDQALAASPIQRRAWVDEAAGVMRYRVRRQESLRRLEGAEAELNRALDVIRELEAQMGPLEAEAADARRCRAAKGALREIEVGLLTKEAVEAGEAVRQAAAQGRELEQAQGDEEGRAAAAEVQIADEAAQAGALEARYDALRQDREELAVRAEQAAAARQVALSRLEGLDGLARSIAEEEAGHAERLAQAQADLEASAAEEAQRIESLAEIERESGADEGEIKALQAGLREVEGRLAGAKKAAAERHRREIQREHQAERRSQIADELKGLDESEPELAAALSDGEAQEKESLAAVEAAQQEGRQAEQDRKGLAEQARTADLGSRKARERLAALEGRRSGLQATLDSYEGLNQGARAVMAAVAEGLLDDIYTPVAEAVHAPADLALAIETALGGAAGDLITHDERGAREAIQVLKERRLGRATFQPLTLMRRQAISEEMVRLEREPGVVGRASGLVQCAEDVRSVVESLLGRVLIVEDLDTALHLARTRGWSRIVTREGEVVHSSGAVAGGQARHQSSGMIQRKAELEAIEAEIEGCQRAVQTAAKLHGRLDGLRAEIDQRAEAARRRKAEADEELSELRSWKRGLEQELAGAARVRARLAKELAELDTDAGELPPMPDLAGIEAERDALLRQAAARAADADQARLRLEERAEALRRARSRKAEAERRLAKIRDAEGERGSRLSGIEGDRTRWTAARDQAVREEAGLAQALEEKSQAIRLCIEARALLQDRRRTHEAGLEEGRRRIAALAESRHQCELRRARAEGRRAACEQRLLEEYGLTLDQAAAESRPPEDGAEKIAARLRREIKEMGEVNLGAIDACDRLAARLEELRAQTGDIGQGIEEIRAGIRDLDGRTRSRFKEAFERLQREFAEIFASVFEGGAAELELTEPDSLLDSGVEIQVTLPGKRRQRLALLSGGERALSALSFLFALLKIKPSPLVILDEVDAPLDGRNVERCIQLIRRFTDQTQFIVVTHNPTTIAAADVWFGVTMQAGVSTLIPMTAPPREREAAAL